MILLAKTTFLLSIFSVVVCSSLSRFVHANKIAKLSTLFMFINVWLGILLLLHFKKLCTDFAGISTCSSVVVDLLKWMQVGELDLVWQIKLDSLSLTMLVVVTIVSFVVHLYSIGYMQGEKGLARYMCYLSLFTFFMIVLIGANNLVQLFVGWEGVGFCSYLLIGFYYRKESANKASLKAFITNRVADMSLIVGLALMMYVFSSLDVDIILNSVPSFTDHTITIFGIEVYSLSLMAMLILIGAMGKSAQVGLHVWLPDAMEGPTPVSALIHAATMVTAGVFLIVRLSVLFDYTPLVSQVMLVVGIITALFAATIAIVQNDIKKIIAYSTCSQLGYMFIACGLGAYTVAMFHLITHAFFKALLFLGAGNVIHHTHHEQNISKMGNYKKSLPITYLMFLIGVVALSGIPPLAGFYSKELILESAYISHASFAKFAYYIGLLVAVLTCFYSFRLLFLVFHNNSVNEISQRITINSQEQVIMLLPLLVLSVGAVISGWLGDSVLHIVDLKYWQGSIMIARDNILHKFHDTHLPLLIKLLPVILVLLTVIVAYVLYMKNSNYIVSLSKLFALPKKLFAKKYYIDELYSAILVKPMFIMSRFLIKKIDYPIIDSYGPLGISRLMLSMSKWAVKIYNGFIYNYIILMILSILIIMLMVI